MDPNHALASFVFTQLAVFSSATFACLNHVQAEQLSEDIETIEIQGTFRKANIQNISSSISLFSQKDIQQREAHSLDELLGAAANVNFARGASRGRFIQIRGIGERSQFIDPVNPSVGLIVDGINYSGLTGSSLLFDSQQVEIFRGPQGTEFGADCVSRGWCNITSHQPSGKFEWSI